MTRNSVALLLLCVGCLRDVQTEFPAGLAPLEDNSAPAVDAGDSHGHRATYPYMVYLNFTYIPGTEKVYALPGTPEDAAQLRQRPKPDSQHFTSTFPPANEFGAKSLECPSKPIASLDMRCKLCRLDISGMKGKKPPTALPRFNTNM